MSLVFEFLFKYRLYFFQKGSLGFRPLWPWYVTLLLVAGALFAGFIIYRRTAGLVSPGWRLTLSAMRILAFLIILLLLLQPVLVLHSALPQQSFVAVAYDQSRSMTLRDEAGQKSRGEVLAELLRPGPGGLPEALAKRFRLRFFAFSGNAERKGAYAEAAAAGDVTAISRSLDQMASELGQAPVSGVVLLTDGVDTSGGDLQPVISRFRAARIPIYPVALGAESLSPDVEVARVSAARQVLQDSLVEADVSIRSAGLAGRRARLQVLEGERVLQSREVVLGGDDEMRSHRMAFAGGAAGDRVFSVRISPFDGEKVVQNNEQPISVRVLDEQPRVLYVEGEPRWIFAFLRRASLQDKNVRLVSILRQADGKFLRQGIEDPGVLEQGFPTDKKELFRYKALILGSLEAAFFSFDQLRMISEFVSRRGGGLLALGGRKSFAQGGYGDTPLAEALPFQLEAGSAPDGFREVEYRARLTAAGREHPVTRVSPEEADNAKRWTAAPPLDGLNPVGSTRAGALVLLQAEIAGGRGETPLLLFQRFGRGRVMALATASTWRWRMGLDSRDRFHDSFWKQSLRWLVGDSPDQVSLTTDRPFVSPEESVELRAEVSDESFVPVNSATVVATVKAPSGEISTLPLSWDARKEGNYSAHFKPRENGAHEVRTEATAAGRSMGAAAAGFRVGESDREFFGARRNTGLLRRLAAETGGRYYRPEETATLAEDIAIVENGASRLEERELWDMPALFLLLAGCLAAEWILRRRKGLA